MGTWVKEEYAGKVCKAPEMDHSFHHENENSPQHRGWPTSEAILQDANVRIAARHLQLSGSTCPTEKWTGKPNTRAASKHCIRTESSSSAEIYSRSSICLDVELPTDPNPCRVPAWKTQPHRTPAETEGKRANKDAAPSAHADPSLAPDTIPRSGKKFAKKIQSSWIKGVDGETKRQNGNPRTEEPRDAYWTRKAREEPNKQQRTARWDPRATLTRSG